MRIKYQNNSMVVISDITAVAFAKAQKFAPESLQVKDDKGNTTFAVGKGSAQIKPYCTQFNAIVDGNMAVTIPFEMGVAGDDAKKVIEDSYALGLAALAANEETIMTAIEESTVAIAVVMESIEIE